MFLQGRSAVHLVFLSYHQLNQQLIEQSDGVHTACLCLLSQVLGLGKENK